MSGETTTTTLNDITYSAWIESAWLDYAYDWVVAQQFFTRRFSLVGKPSKVAQIPRITSDMGTVGANGQGVDTEFDGAEGTDLSNTALDTDNSQVTVSEYALMRTITDNVEEDSVSGLDIMNKVIADAARIIMTAVEKVCVDLFASLSNSAGTPGSDITIAQALAGHVAIRTRGFRAPDGLVYVLDDTQTEQLEAALINITTNVASYAGATDRLLGVDKTANNGHGNGHVMNFRGFPVYSQGLSQTLNTGGNVTGAVFTPSSEANDPHVTFALVDKRPFRVEPQRDASLRASEMVFSHRVGAGIGTNGSGTLFATDS